MLRGVETRRMIAATSLDSLEKRCTSEELPDRNVTSCKKEMETSTAPTVGRASRAQEQDRPTRAVDRRGTES